MLIKLLISFCLTADLLAVILVNAVLSGIQPFFDI